MAHFAKVDENNIVQEVLVFDVADDDLPLMELPSGWKWVRTSYNNNIRKNYAGIGYTYDEERDAFIPICPFESWTLDEETCRWVSPVPHPQDGKLYIWNEEQRQYVLDPNRIEV